MSKRKYEEVEDTDNVERAEQPQGDVEYEEDIPLDAAEIDKLLEAAPQVRYFPT